MDLYQIVQICQLQITLQYIDKNIDGRYYIEILYFSPCKFPVIKGFPRRTWVKYRA